MDYNTALRRLLSLTDYERAAGVAPRHQRYDLGRIEAFLERLGHPHKCAPVVHIAGTKGKGSTAALCASALRAQGYSVGLYTSPHLHSFRERIRTNGHPLSEGEFASLVEDVWPMVVEFSRSGGLGDLTLFETLTAMAFWQFSRRRVDFQVVEVGLGGRLDSTNVVEPEVCVITSLSLDHTSILGETMEKIAYEKAGIIKPGTVVVSAPQREEARRVVREVCASRGALLEEVERSVSWRSGQTTLEGQAFHVDGGLGSYDLWMPLLGDHQLENAVTSVAALEALMKKGHALAPEALARGFSRVEWPCRLEVLRRSPLMVADGAHNPYSAAKLREAISAYFPFRRVILVFGALGDKNLLGMVEELSQLNPTVLATRSRHPRSVASSKVAEAFRGHGVSATAVEGVREAVVRALDMAHEGDLVLAAGSLFVAAEAREFQKGIAAEVYPEVQDGMPSAQRAAGASRG